jgi:hypothetical protein
MMRETTARFNPAAILILTRSAQRNPNAAGYSAPFSLSGAAAAWKAALHAR